MFPDMTLHKHLPNVVIQCSPDEMKWNPGLRRPASPDFVSLYPGYSLVLAAPVIFL